MSRENQIKELAEILWEACETSSAERCGEKDCNECMAKTTIDTGYRKQSENVIELPCKVGDLVRFKGLETPWKVSAIHIYEGGQPQISITSETGKITSTMTANEFYMFCFVIDDAKMKGGAE